MLGIMLFFDGALLALGKLRALLSPFPSLWSPQLLHTPRLTSPRVDSVPKWPLPHHRPAKDVLLFALRDKLRGMACFLGGILFVFLRWPITGVLIEMFGFLNLFGCVPLRVAHIALNDLIPSICQRLFPCHHHLSPPTVLHWPA